MPNLDALFKGGLFVAAMGAAVMAFQQSTPVSAQATKDGTKNGTAAKIDASVDAKELASFMAVRK